VEAATAVAPPATDAFFRNFLRFILLLIWNYEINLKHKL